MAPAFQFSSPQFFFFFFCGDLPFTQNNNIKKKCKKKGKGKGKEEKKGDVTLISALPFTIVSDGI